MKTAYLFVWIYDNKPFGIFTDKKKAEEALSSAAKSIKITVENLKADLYYYEMPLNKFVIMNTILEF